MRRTLPNCWLLRQEEDHKSRDVSSLWKVENAQKPPPEPPKGTQACYALPWRIETYTGFLSIEP